MNPAPTTTDKSHAWVWRVIIGYVLLAALRRFADLDWERDFIKDCGVAGLLYSVNVFRKVKT